MLRGSSYGSDVLNHNTTLQYPRTFMKELRKCMDVNAKGLSAFPDDMESNYFTCALGDSRAHGQEQCKSTIRTFIEEQASASAQLPAVGFITYSIDPDDPWEPVIWTFKEVQEVSLRAAAVLAHQINPSLSDFRSVALLCQSTSEFVMTWLGLTILGYPVLLLAPQCTAAAAAHLCRLAGSKVLFYNRSYETLAQESREELEKIEDQTLSIQAIPEYHCSKSEVQKREIIAGFAVSSRNESDDTAYFFHTSGTSGGLPKLIPQTHQAAVGVVPSLAGSKSASFTTTPLYHGGIADLFRAWKSNAMIWLFPGKDILFTAKNIARCLDIADKAADTGRCARVKYFSSVPYIMQMLAEDTRAKTRLREMSIVGIGGAALPTNVGDELVASGVNLISRYGSAECGFLMSSHRDYTRDKEWQYLRDTSQCGQLSFEKRSDGLSELIVKPEWPHVASPNRKDGSFATADLFQPHATLPDAWKYVSRSDSQLTLLTGKKFDPAPLEMTVAQWESVEDVLIFGNARPYPGALLFIASTAYEVTKAKLEHRIGALLKALNAESQKHAEISESMIIILSTDAGRIKKSSKGTILRKAAEEQFREVIDAAYTSGGRNMAGTVKDSDVLEKVLEIVSDTIGKPKHVTPSTDLFSAGVDSVASLQIRSRVAQLLPPLTSVPLTIVEDCGNPQRLARYIIKKRAGSDETVDDAKASVELMRKLVDDFGDFQCKLDGQRRHQCSASSDLEASISQSADEHRGDHTLVADSKSRVVVLTGVTGLLGAHVLDIYRRDAEVSKIFCLVRGKNDLACFQRVQLALEQHKLNPLLRCDKKVVAVCAELGEYNLGIPHSKYQEIAREVTEYVHMAWAVNFRLNLESFVKDHITGLNNLISLALSTTRLVSPKFVFCSSVASAAMFNEPSMVPERIMTSPSVASPLGYSKSKWVAEQICRRADESTRLSGNIAVVRVGQLSGNSSTGVWNEKEAWPLMLSTVKTIKCLPELPDQYLDWVPVDVAAQALYQVARNMCNNTKTREHETSVFHTVKSGHDVAWADLLTWLQKHRCFDRVNVKDWLDRLELSQTTGTSHPAYKLIDIWRAAYINCRQQPVRFATDETVKIAPILQKEETIDELYFSVLWDWIEQNC